jgi:hypothetical protein
LVDILRLYVRVLDIVVAGNGDVPKGVDFLEEVDCIRGVFIVQASVGEVECNLTKGEIRCLRNLPPKARSDV